MSSFDESMDAFIVNSDSGSDFNASPPPTKKAKKSPIAKAPAKPKTAKSSTATTAAKAKKTSAVATADKPKKTAAAAASKPKAAPKKKKKAVESDDGSDDAASDAENRPMDLDDDDESDAPGPSKKKAAPAKKGGDKSASDMYQKLTQIEHVLKRPDTYIGSIEPQSQDMWVYDSATKGMAYRNITYVPGLYKIFDEILVNAADNKRNDASMDVIKVVIDREEGVISCYNNGRGIPVEIHAKEGFYIPELIFGHLLTSSNYDDDEKKVTGGRNGYGAKLANIYSREFIIETADKKNGKKYKQVFKNNMGEKGAPKISDNKKGEEWTKITFRPDFVRFGMPDGIDDDVEALLKKRVYDMAGTVAGVKVELNGEKIKVKNFKQYVEMYTQAVNEVSAGKKKGKGKAKDGGSIKSREESEAPGSPSNLDDAAAVKTPIIYEKFGDRWEVAFAPSDGQFQQVSFVNSIATSKGGTHVEYVAKQIVEGILDNITKKAKKAVTTLKPFTVKSHLWVFINCLIENPQFDSQTKENMTLLSSKFGSKCSIGEPFLKKVANSGVLDSIMNFAQFKQDQLLKKTDGHKRSRMLGIAKLDDANHAGTKNAKNCTLILTEGDSAKTFAISGLAVVGRDTYGVFPLRGKLLNVRDASGKQLTDNQEIQYLKQILGLQHGKSYTSVDSLRYGRLMVMTDQDHDGSHIKGLIINWLDFHFPGLLQIPGFLVEFITPIVRVTRKQQTLSFFTIPEYESWKEENDNGRGWKIKYYKGLGTSEAALARQYFSDLKTHMLKFKASGNEDRALVDMAFNKKKADDRKEWLRGFVPGTYLDQSIKEIPIRDFINKELILFSMADNLRSIPSVVDGLKPGQRKVLFGCFKKGLKGEIKVAQLVGYIGEHSAYHHGEASLAGTIVGLAQNFVGNNNVNLLSPNGQFGTRLQGGKDHASPRYIFTAVAPITRTIFHKDDDAVLTYLNDDGQSIEPNWYMPILPMVLVNGSDGIGTGWSSAIPNYNPLDITANLRRKMRGEPMEPMHPWFRGFRGITEEREPGKYTTSGVAMMTDDETVEIFELPIRSWTNSYVEQLLAWSQGSEKQPALVREYTSQSSDTAVHLTVVLTGEGKSAVRKEGLEKALKLTSSVATSNMVCFDVNGKIKKYSSPEEIISDFYDVRLSYYMKRKEYLVAELTTSYERLSNQARFIQMFIKGTIKVAGRPHNEIVRDLRKLEFRPFPKVKKAVVAADPDASTVIQAMDESDNDDDMDEDIDGPAGSLSDFDYLLDMKIRTLTAAKARALMAERDAKERELNALLGMTPKKLWETDLQAFEAEWEVMLEQDEKVRNEAPSKGMPKGKGKVGQVKAMNTIVAAFAAAQAKAKARSGKESALITSASQASSSASGLAHVPGKLVKAMQASPQAKKSADDSSPVPATVKPKAAAKPKAKAAAPVAASKPKKKPKYDDSFDEDESDADITIFSDNDESDNNADMKSGDDDEDSEVEVVRKKPRKVVDLSDSEEEMDQDDDESDEEQSFVIKPKKR